MRGNNGSMAETAKWYVVHTYSGYENKVAENIRKVVENRKLQDIIPEVMVPLEKVADDEIEETADQKGKKAADKKLFPSYVLVKMVMTDETWYIVRNTRGVTGFVGPGSKPIPLTDKEVEALGVDTRKAQDGISLEVGAQVVITGDKLNGVYGTVQEIDAENKNVVITVSMFGRETAVTLPIYQVEKI